MNMVWRWAYLGDRGSGRSHVLPVDEDVHGVVVAPLHANTVPDLETSLGLTALVSF